MTRGNKLPPGDAVIPVSNVLSSLCLFFSSGRTFTFRDVIIATDNESAIAFSYRAMSDGLRKTATFSKFHVVGTSITR